MNHEYLADITNGMADYYVRVTSGEQVGITTGFEKIDKRAGRLESGQMWVVGGYSGVGKSYFILSMIEGILEEGVTDPIAVFTTELSATAYSLRHAFMRAGIWKKSFENNPGQYAEAVKQKIMDYSEDLIASKFMKIVAVNSFEDVVKNLEQSKFSVVFVDYVQELSVEGIFGAKDAMPKIAGKLKSLAVEKSVPVVVVSQITNAAAKSSEYGVAPFDYGKELNRAAHTSIVLSREQENGQLKRLLNVNIVKARDGEVGNFDLEVLTGYRLKDAQADNS